jgi:hypothetical protein
MRWRSTYDLQRSVPEAYRKNKKASVQSEIFVEIEEDFFCSGVAHFATDF